MYGLHPIQLFIRLTILNPTLYYPESQTHSGFRVGGSGTERLAAQLMESAY